MAEPALALPDDAPHLLVVDDDRRIRDLLSRFLHGEGYRVTTADNAADARAKLGSLSFDLLILDVMMPGETGFQLAKSLRESSAVPILMLTAPRPKPKAASPGLEIGADDYVPKPFEPRELSLRIANILKRTIPAPVPAVESVRFGDFVFHLGRGELRRGEEVDPSHRPRARHAARSLGDAGRDRAAPWRSPATAAARTSARSTCRSTACAARSSAIRPIRCSCRPCAASATAWWCRHDDARHRPCHAALRGRACVGGVGRARALAQELDADRPLCPRAADHHRADGGAAVGRRLRVHGAALEHGDAAALGRR